MSKGVACSSNDMIGPMAGRMGAPHPYRPELDMLTVYDLFVKHIVQPLPNALQQIKTTLTVSFPPALNLPPLTKN